MDALEVVMTRVSPARIGEAGPSPEQVQQLLAAAVSAPDHGRLRPWRFIVIEGLAREKFGDVIARAAKLRDPQLSEMKIEAERKKASRAPLLIIAAAQPVPHPGVPEIEQIVAVGAAIENLVIAAHDMGFGVLWRTGAAAYDASVKEALNLKNSDTIVGILYIGKAEEPGRTRDRKVDDRWSNWPA